MITSPLVDGSEESLVALHDGALLDLDGVLYVGPAAVPGAAEAVAKARAAGTRVVFVTNNASRTPQTVAAHLSDLGIAADPLDVVTSAQAAASLVAAAVPRGSAVLVVGGEGLEAAALERDLRPVRTMADGPVAVVQGFGPDVGWRLLAEGAYAVRAGLPWVASNLDVTIPTAAGIAPGNGTLVEVIAMATGRRPAVAGKPETPLYAEAVRRLGAERPVVVGDRLDTDIEGANRAGLPSLLVLTGVTTPTDLVLAQAPLRPTYVSRDLLDGLLQPHPPVTLTTSTGGWRCGGWECTVVDDGIDLTGAGDAVDGLRALCAAVWSKDEGVDRTHVGHVLQRLGL
ncbi:MAG: HAD-IIA family hydrolase [Pseudorhodobacter sp.]|nr:HAD-IIA family hydrolase [Frankiaceae bacterium]